MKIILTNNLVLLAIVYLTRWSDDLPFYLQLVLPDELPRKRSE